MATKVKGHKMDAHLVSDEPWEINYIAKLFGVTPKLVRDSKRKMGRPRKKIYNEIRRFLALEP